MNLIEKFLKLSVSDRLFYLEAAFWLGVSRLAIRVLPFRWIAPFLGTYMVQTSTEPTLKNTERLNRIAGAVHAMSNHLPWKCACLPQAVSGKMMLKVRNISGTVYLGVAKDGKHSLTAHAWLRSGDRVLTGRKGVKKFRVVSFFS